MQIKKINLTLVCYLFVQQLAWAQFAPPAGQTGSTAIHKDSSIFVAWANGCTVQRGWQNIADTSLGKASSGDTNSPLGKAGDGTILSLGDGGEATLTFSTPISNGQGADFAIFENSFSATFLELGLVEVSSDGQNFVRFATISNTDTSTQVGSFGAVDATKLYNLAGKYSANYGTPFDLAELAGNPLLDINNITHIRIIDVVGAMQEQYAVRDSKGNKINDPWTTPFPESGFDLDAVGVIHNNSTISVQKIDNSTSKIYPNPVAPNQAIHIETTLQNYSLLLYNMQGQLVAKKENNPNELALPNLAKGIYLLQVIGDKKIHSQKIKIQ